MKHIIDANNLAGKLKLLDEADFDKQLIELIKEYNRGKTREIFLVFDSLDPMGDKHQEDNVTIIYTPRDDYYSSADDKIVELVRNFKKEKQVAVITDDIEIKEKIKKINLDNDSDIILEQATDFAKKLEKFFEKQLDKDLINDEEGMSKEDKDEVNKELLDIWK